MLHRYMLLAAFVGPFALQAQVSNALDLDGQDDQVVVSNASQFIAGAPGISMGCWVYPRNLTSTYPDFDGYAGFRNEVDADFYLVQISPGQTVEGRFRNSSGSAFTVSFDDIPLNAWSFVALVYNGAQLRIYLDGVQQGAVAANGSISNTAVPFLLGNVAYGLTEFLLDGRLDEVSLWDRALTPNEVACLPQGAELGTDGPVLYYKCDQGVAAGSNGAITTLTDLMGHANGTLQGFALTGAGSNFVQGTAGGGTTVASLCPGDTYTFQGQLFDTPGAHTVAIAGAGACPAMATLLLQPVAVNVTVVQTGQTLQSTAPFGPYQWLDCGNGFAPVTGATSQSFTPATAGSFALRITQNGCTDTSACFLAGPTGMEDHLGPIVSWAPVPVQDELTLTLGAGEAPVGAAVLDVQGRLVKQLMTVPGAVQRWSLADLGGGTYLVQVRTATAVGTVRIVKL